MDADINPLKNLPNLQVRHLIMQILAWMWVSICSLYMGSVLFWGINAIAHTLLLAAIVITVGTFETAKRNPKVFNKIDGYNGRRNTGEMLHMAKDYMDQQWTMNIQLMNDLYEQGQKNLQDVENAYAIYSTDELMEKAKELYSFVSKKD